MDPFWNTTQTFYMFCVLSRSPAFKYTKTISHVSLEGFTGLSAVGLAATQGLILTPMS